MKLTNSRAIELRYGGNWLNRVSNVDLDIDFATDDSEQDDVLWQLDTPRNARRVQESLRSEA